MSTADKPSFSRYLRVIGKLGPKAPDINIEELFERRRQWKKTIKIEATWEAVKSNYSRNFRCSTEVINKMLKPLRAVAREVVGSEADESLVDDAAVSLLALLLKEKFISRAVTTQLVTTFGTLSNSLANKALEVVKTLASNLDENKITSLQAVCKGEKEDKTDIWEFGSDIKVPSPVLWDPPDTSFLEPLLLIHKTSNVLDTFSMNYNSYSGVSDVQDTSTVQYDKKWLTHAISIWYPEMPAFENAEMCECIGNQLQSARSNDELQGELLDVIGIDKIELLHELIEHRNEFNKNLSRPACEDSREKITFKSWKATQLIPLPRKPQLGCQVTVQSEKEMQLNKQFRKEEKKLLKVSAQQSQPDSDAEEEFTISDLRAKRITELTKEQKRPLFGPNKIILPRRDCQESYPFVYDNQRDAKASAAYVGDKKMMLPEGVERKNTKNYEEVSIPIPPVSELPVGGNLIQVSSLDEVCQLAFKNIERLNRIQSIVYDTAYNTNENLLICAPTGAGKTNVALLSMMRTIKTHIVNAVINKDKFKIVYIAPMKALAAEMAKSFSMRLGPLSVIVRELTGDMQLTKSEIKETQVLVTTPEKWDVVTRKGGGDNQLVNLVQLVIIDEVHLLHGDRGPVVETLVARTLRLVETTQSMIRIVGLSATLPNYLDVAAFLRVNPYKGLFYFDGRFRPVPLSMSFVGVKSTRNLQQMQDMDDLCYDKVLEMVRKGHQVMVFVHTRNGTSRTANMLRDKAQIKNELEMFATKQTVQFSTALRAMSGSRNKVLADLFSKGFAIHHAGMLRHDRNMVEKYFGEGLISVLVCTSTLAWGVNLPAHAVIIRGTEIYDAKHGSFVDLGILDVLQIFGRAGRPQFDHSGHGCIITTHDKLNHYLSLLTNQYPIESNFVQCLVDNLNAEDDSALAKFRRNLIITAANKLCAAMMIRFELRLGDFFATDIGRTASYFYIKYDTMEIFNDKLQTRSKDTQLVLDDAAIISLLSQAEEFHQLKVRDDEMDELDYLINDYCELPVSGGVENLHGKVNVLIQTYLSRGRINSFSLASDQSYISQNTVRIARALFDIVLKKNNALLAGRLLKIAKMLELQMWDFHHPLHQFPFLGPEILKKIEERKLSIETLREMPVQEIGIMIKHQKKASDVKRCAEEFPSVEVESVIQPITRSILRIRLTIKPTFRWKDAVHGRTSENLWVWLEDPDSNRIYHYEYLLLTKKQIITREPQELVVTIPVYEEAPSQFLVRIINDKWLRSETIQSLNFQQIILPNDYPPNTDLLRLTPLPVTALQDPILESLYPFEQFNPVQTQVFHCLYHTDENVVLGAPTGSGKTLAAELAMFRVFKKQPGAKVVYIAPLKALVRERVEDWKVKIEQKLGKRVIELTGDATPDARAIANADVIVTTPEKWDGVSRSWQTRGYVRQVALLVIDEIHLLGEERGPVLEVIVSRASFIAEHAAANQVQKCRVVGLSTALANAGDLAAWLGIKTRRGFYNFRPSVRPVPIKIHVQGFPGKHYCPRMATMNKPTFQAIRLHSPNRPVLIFVSSRRQTRLTGLDLISFLSAEDNPKQWLHMDDGEADQLAACVSDPNLMLLLPFGIGIHHAGLKEHDRKLVERLFNTEKIQVLIATSTLAWGVNFPAHLVVIKGTEYYDAKQRRYVDMPITDVMQMIGRAGRPQYDNEAVAVLLVQDIKKMFLKRFLHDPFPVESSLLTVLPDHISAEIVAGTIKTKPEVLDYLTWTYFFRRLLKNPSYYKLTSLEPDDINLYLSNLVNNTINTLIQSKCVIENEDDRGLQTTYLGRIASFYYLSHKTVALFDERLRYNTTFEQLLKLLSDTVEYEELPVRHNEDGLNTELAKLCVYKADPLTMDSPHTKTFLLFQAHLSRLELPCTDYSTDLKSVLDQSIRIIQAIVDVCAESGYLTTALRSLLMLQGIVQGAWPDQSSVCALPYVEPPLARKICNLIAPTLPELHELAYNSPQVITNVLSSKLSKKEISEVLSALRELPCPEFRLSIQGWWDGGKQVDELVVPDQNTEDPYIQLHADQDYVLCIKQLRGNKYSHAHAPRFPRSKDVGWVMILGLEDQYELLALKRVPANGRTVNLSFTTPSKLGKAVLTLYIISNCYLGIDQQYDVHVEVIDSSIEAQFNTETVS